MVVSIENINKDLKACRNEGGKRMSEQEQSLREEVKRLEKRIGKLEKDMMELEFLVPKPVISSAQIGQIGGFVLGAIALIGIFWL